MRRILFLIMCYCSFGYGAQSMDEVISETLIVWIALFLLAGVGITILFIASQQMTNIKRLHQEIFQKQLEIEEKQNSFLVNMGERILDATNEVTSYWNQLSEDFKTLPLKQTLAKAIKVENSLLSMTSDLISFLRLKSKKLEIIEEPFNINNVLNEITGSLNAQFSKTNTELIFDIDNNVPKKLIGDSLHLGQILENLIENAIEMTPHGEVEMHLSAYKTSESKAQLQFQISDTGSGINPERLKRYFDPYYDEMQKEYIGLGLFVAKELTELMGGTLTIQSIVGKGTIFTVFLPFRIADPENRRQYRLSEKELSEKKVLIIDKHYNAALALKKLFAYFRHDVKVISSDEFLYHIPNLSDYDILVLHEDLFTVRMVEYLKKIKSNNEIKVIGLSSLFHPVKNSLADDIVDIRLKKPLSQERIYELIIDMYQWTTGESIEESAGGDRRKNPLAVAVHSAPIAETKNISRENFADFNDSTVLIVEDDLINQKVLVSILGKSSIEIRIANNGKEAVEMVASEINIFNLILMDINMPIMDGYEASRRIRSLGRFDDLPIVSLTALVLDSEVQKMYQSGINAFLPKPLNIGQLYTIFKLYIGIKPNNKDAYVGRIAVDQKIDGLDVRLGLKYTANNEALYLEILKEFFEAYGESGALFKRMVDENRLEQLKKLCLDMKGLTGSIGATEMHRQVDEIYRLFIYNYQHMLPDYVKLYQKELSRLNKAIQAYIDTK